MEASASKHEVQQRLNPAALPTGRTWRAEGFLDIRLVSAMVCISGVRKLRVWVPSEGLPSMTGQQSSSQPALEADSSLRHSVSGQLQLATAACYILIPEMPPPGWATGCLPACVLDGPARNSKPPVDIGEADGLGPDT